MGRHGTLLLAAIGGSFFALTAGHLGAQQPAFSASEYYAGADDDEPGPTLAKDSPVASGDGSSATTTDDLAPSLTAPVSLAPSGLAPSNGGCNPGGQCGYGCRRGCAPCFTCPSPCGCATPCCSFRELMGASLFGDVYATPSQWRPMPLGTLFSEGWNESWVSAINASGGAPRQGWINALDGVFYRLVFTSLSAQQNLMSGGNAYLAYTTIFVPVSRRFQVRVDAPFVASNPNPAGGYSTNFGNLTIYPRVLLMENKETTVVFEMPVRTGTGSTVNGNGYTSVGPNVSFWHNVAGGWVARGGVGTTIPTGGDTVGIRTTADAFFSVGNYITPHDALPFGDFVYYLSTIVHTPIDNRAGPSYTYVSLTPGFRCHVGDNWYVLGGLEVPVVGPVAYQYAPTGWLMKVF